MFRQSVICTLIAAACFAPPPNCPSTPSTCSTGVPPVGFPPNVPASLAIPVIGCNTDHYSGLLCAGEGTLSTLNLEGDIAVLVLAERIDVGLTGSCDEEDLLGKFHQPSILAISLLQISPKHNSRMYASGG